MTESLTYRMQLCKDRYNDIPQCLINEVQVMEDKSAIYKKRPSKPYEENKTTKSLTGRLINLFHRCDSTIRLDSISLTDEVRALVAENAIYKERLSKPYEENKMTESLADRFVQWQRRVFIHNDTFETLVNEVRALEVLAKMRPMKDVEQEEEINKLKAQLAEYTYTPQAYDEMWKRVKEAVNENDVLKTQLEDCTAVNAEVMKKVARLEKSINNQETDSN